MSLQQDDRALLRGPLELSLEGRVVWLTGASRGLGRTLAYALAGAGARLLLAARSTAALDAIALELRDHGAEVETVDGSITDPATVGRAASVIEERWGTLDVLINNAGISPSFTRAERLDESDWREVLDVNLSAVLACCRAALPLLERAGGSVVNISSIHGSRAHERLIAYAVSKGGLDMLTKTLAVEWATRGIRVNGVAPGYLETEMTAGLRANERLSNSLLARIPMRRFGTTEEVAAAVLFLAGTGSSYITGTTLYVDGGWTAS
jgi:NAD(P)-dependent dehydrogenase (short-subunit alcohol dehydrogenase family)